MKQFSYPNAQFISITGGASIGWKMNVYNTGTTDFASIYSDVGQTVETDNPVIANEKGFFASFYWTGTVDVVVTDADDNIIDSAEGIQDLVSTILANITAGGAIPAGEATGDGDAIAVTLATQTTDFADLSVFVVRANAANSGTVSTPNLTVNAFPSRRIKKIGGSALIANDIVTNQNMLLLYNEAQDCYYLLNHEATFLKRDGSAGMLGNLNFNGFKGTNLLAAAAEHEVPRFDQINTHYGSATGTADAMTATIASVFSYADGMTLKINAPSGSFSTSSAPTININSLGNKTIVDSANNALGYGDIVGLVELVYVSGLSKFVLTNPRFGDDFVGNVHTGYFSSNPGRDIPAAGDTFNRSDYPILTAYVLANSDMYVSEGSWSSNKGKFSTGDGSTTMRAPDLRGRFIRIYAGAGSIDSGRAIFSMQDDAFQNITGTLTTVPANAGTDGTGVFSRGASGLGNATSSISDPTSYVMNFDASNSSGARTSTETRPTNVAFPVSIRAK